jgi:hypothetical protein
MKSFLFTQGVFIAAYCLILMVALICNAAIGKDTQKKPRDIVVGSAILAGLVTLIATGARLAIYNL